MVQMHYIYCAIYFYYYYISFTSDQQALDPQGWGLLLHNELTTESKLLSRALERGCGSPTLLPVSRRHSLATWVQTRVQTEEGTVWWD